MFVHTHNILNMQTPRKSVLLFMYFRIVIEKEGRLARDKPLSIEILYDKCLTAEWWNSRQMENCRLYFAQGEVYLHSTVYTKQE